MTSATSTASDSRAVSRQRSVCPMSLIAAVLILRPIRPAEPREKHAPRGLATPRAPSGEIAGDLGPH